VSEHKYIQFVGRGRRKLADMELQELVQRSFLVALQPPKRPAIDRYDVLYAVLLTAFIGTIVYILALPGLSQ
jgi:hypothetical protein